VPCLDFLQAITNVFEACGGLFKQVLDSLTDAIRLALGAEKGDLTRQTRDVCSEREEAIREVGGKGVELGIILVFGVVGAAPCGGLGYACVRAVA
jgi:hypothetical protein